MNADTGFINNTFLRWLGLDPVAWYSTPGAWPIILVIVNLWKNVGYQSIIFMAAISGIDKSLFEAAAIDGARILSQISINKLPLLYRGLMELNNVGMSAAAGLYQSIVGFVLVLIANQIVRKLDADNALF